MSKTGITCHLHGSGIGFNKPNPISTRKLLPESGVLLNMHCSCYRDRGGHALSGRKLTSLPDCTVLGTGHPEQSAKVLFPDSITSSGSQVLVIKESLVTNTCNLGSGSCSTLHEKLK